MYSESTDFNKNSSFLNIGQIELTEYSSEALLQNEDQIHEILDFLVHQYAAHYFVALALFTKRHIESYLVARFKGKIIGLMAKRKSGKVHIVGRILDHHESWEWLGRTQVKSLLMHEELLDCPKSIKNITTTSTVMQVKLKSNSSSRLALPPSGDDFKFLRLTQEHIPQAIDFYAQFMKGSVSKEDMEVLLKLGSVAVAYISTKTQEIVAIGQVGLWHGNAGILYGILVHPHLRGRGFGRHIVRVLLDSCHEGIEKVGLLTNNPVAISLYASFGFIENGNLIEATL